MGFLNNMGTMEIVVILAVVILIFGPSQLPKLARSMGETVKNFRKAGKELREGADDINDAITRD